MSSGERKPVEHYAQGEIETIDYIYDTLGGEGGLDYVLGNILKYASRARYKGQLRSDLEKIKNYAELALEKLGPDPDATIHGTYRWILPEDGLSPGAAKKFEELKKATSDAYAQPGTELPDPADYGFIVASEEEIPLPEYRKAVAGKNGQFDPEDDG